MYSAASAMLADEITSGLSKGKIYDMSHLLDRYKQVLEVKEHFLRQLSQREAQKKNERPFLRPNSHREAERPFEAGINLFQSFVSCRHSKTSVFQQFSEDFEVDEDTRQDMEQDKATSLYQAAQIIKNDIQQCNGISIKPLCVDDVSIEKGRCLIPESL